LKTFIVRLWNSPTFTTWVNQAVQALRLLAVTPLLLVSFNVTEIAAWYLFGSLAFLGSLIAQRVGLTFTRMIAFAMSGTTNLSAIKGKAERRPHADPNWPLIERAYATIGSLNAYLTLGIIAVALIMGWYGLENLLADYKDANTVWTAFGVVIFSQSVVFFFQRYSIALKGMNYVALTNRWDATFSFLSVIAGVVVLQMGGGILTLTCFMQGVILLNVLRNRFLLRFVEGGRFKSFRAYKLDRQMLGWAWEPSWKGFIVSLANSGTIQVTAVFAARFLPVAEAASLLLTLRLLTSFKSVSDAPFLSHMPRIARLFAEGNTELLRQIAPRKILICQIMFGGLIFGLVILGSPVLALIGSNATLTPAPMTALLGLGLLLTNFIGLSIILSASGNHIVCVQREILAFIVTAVSLYLLLPAIGGTGVLIGLFFPAILFLNVVPARIAAGKLGVSTSSLVSKTALLPASIPCVSFILAILLS
jgi:O-antigen/teichoic acid export membrane protein